MRDLPPGPESTCLHCSDREHSPPLLRCPKRVRNPISLHGPMLQRKQSTQEPFLGSMLLWEKVCIQRAPDRVHKPAAQQPSRYGGFPKNQGIVGGVPMVRTMVFWGLRWVHQICGNNHFTFEAPSGKFRRIVAKGKLSPRLPSTCYRTT